MISFVGRREVEPVDVAVMKKRWEGNRRRCSFPAITDNLQLAVSSLFKVITKLNNTIWESSHFAKAGGMYLYSKWEK